MSNMNTNPLTEEQKQRMTERLEKVEELIDTEGKQWFARFDCESGTYKQLEDLKAEREELLNYLSEKEEEEERV